MFAIIKGALRADRKLDRNALASKKYVFDKFKENYNNDDRVTVSLSIKKEWE